MAQVEDAMVRFDAERARIREERRDLLVERGLARAVRGRYYARMFGGGE
jgi:hypothetical protein